MCYNTLRLSVVETLEVPFDASVAQSVEQLIRNQQVRCSSHPTSSIERHPYFELFYRNTGGFLSKNLDLSRLSGFCVLEEPQSERENREVVFIH